MNSLSLYIHVPFCTGKCGYCDFYSRLPVCGTEIDAYVDAVIAHICRKAPVFRDRTIETVYFGGGTPSLVGATNLCRVLDAIRGEFALSGDCEITTEANPGDIFLGTDRNPATRFDALKTLHDAGFNRISLGVQSSNDAELRTLSRRHTFSQAQDAVSDVRKAGFDNLTLDLMYGLPGQTDEAWRQSLADIIALAPEHISCYALRLEEGTPLYAHIDALPDDDAVYSLYMTAVEVLAAHGYHQYEVSNYARAGRESRHNSRYWTGGDYVSFGPSAHAFVDGVRYAYTNNTAAYVAAVMAGAEPAYSESVTLTEQDRLEEVIMLRLRMASGLDLDALAARFGIETDRMEQTLRSYASHGLCKANGRVYALTPQGMFVQNSIIVSLYAQIE